MIIGVVALVVIGPEQLPGLARKAGFWLGRVRRWVSDVKEDVSKELRAEELKQAIDRNAGLKEIQEIVRRGQEEVNKVSQSDYLVKAIEDDVKADTTESLKPESSDKESSDDDKKESGKQSAE